MFFLKIHESEGKTICAICDSDLLGKIFEENERVLDVDENFFGGKRVSLTEIKEIAKQIRNANSSDIIGNRIITELIKNGSLKASAVKEISRIKHAMVFKI